MRNTKRLLKNNLLSLIVVMLLISLGVVIAGNVIVREGDMDVDETLNVSGNADVAGNVTAELFVGIGNDIILVDGAENRAFRSVRTINLWADDEPAQWFQSANSGENVVFAGYNGAVLPRVLFAATNLQIASAHTTAPVPTERFVLGGNMHLDDDNYKIYFGEGKNASIYWDGTNLIFDYNTTNPTALARFSGNLSAVKYDTRTSVYDKSRGDALDFIKDADDLKTDEEIDHSKFYGYDTYDVTDFDRPETIEEEVDEIDPETGELIVVTVEKIVYPHTKTEEGVSLNAEIDVLRQAVYELKGRLDEVCEKDDSYSWC